MFRNFNNKIQRMGRRRFIKSLIGIGASLPAARALTQDVAAELIDDPRKEVPRIAAWINPDRVYEIDVQADAIKIEDGTTEFLRSDRSSSLVRKAKRTGRSADNKIPVVYTISREKWEQIESAYDGRRKLKQQLNSEGISGSVWVSTEHNEQEIVVRPVQKPRETLTADTTMQMESALPSSVTGTAWGDGRGAGSTREIPVTVEQPSKNSEKSVKGVDEEFNSEEVDPEELYYRYDWETVPVGATMVTVRDLDKQETGWGTTGFVIDDNGTKKMLTAGHNMESAEDEKAWAKTVANWPTEDFKEEQRVTRNVEEEDPMDCSILNPTNVDLSHKHATKDGGKEMGILGGLDKDGIKDLEAGIGAYDTIFQQGARTGRSECEIKSVGDNYAFETDLVSNDDVMVGDSGGPVTYEQVTYAHELGYTIEQHWAAGIISSSPGTFVWASSVPAIEDEFGVEIY